MKVSHKGYVLVAVLIGFAGTFVGQNLLVAHESFQRKTELTEQNVNQNPIDLPENTPALVSGDISTVASGSANSNAQNNNASSSGQIASVTYEEKIASTGAVLAAEKLIPREVKKASPPAAQPPIPVPAPAPPPPPPPPPPVIAQATPSELDGWFRSYSEQYHVDEGILRKIAVCESGYNTVASNGPYLGLFQFSSGTWISARNRMGLDNNPELRASGEESIKTAAYKISLDGTGAWANCD